MAKATIVYFDEIWDYDKKSRIFRITNPKRDTLWVSSFENGIATVDPMCGCTITEFADTIAGCFDEKSNFGREVVYAFNCESGSKFTGIKFEFNGVTLIVTKENANADTIYAEWDAGMKANAEKQRLEWEAYMKTPEYRAKRAKELKAYTRKNAVREEVIHVDETTELEFKDEEAAKIWQKFAEVNSKDGYSNAVVVYARHWGKYMQYLMKKHNKNVIQIAKETSFVSDTEGITGFMYGCAVNILAQCWKYGEELRKWHNKDYGYEGDGVVNPAILTVTA